MLRSRRKKPGVTPRTSKKEGRNCLNKSQVISFPDYPEYYTSYVSVFLVLDLLLTSKFDNEYGVLISKVQLFRNLTHLKIIMLLSNYSIAFTLKNCMVDSRKLITLLDYSLTRTSSKDTRINFKLLIVE